MNPADSTDVHASVDVRSVGTDVSIDGWSIGADASVDVLAEMGLDPGVDEPFTTA